MIESYEKNKLVSLAVKYCGDAKKIKKAWDKGEGDPNYIYPGKVVTPFDSEFPEELNESFLYGDVPPVVLFYKGNIDLLQQNKISVVGSRQPSDYSKKATKEFVLAQNDKVIVSGLALGTDTVAHKYADKTIAVLGCGIDRVYPLQNSDLYNRIASEGLIISEYPLNTEAKPEYFKARNRIIAALGSEVVVMEAKKQSGTIVTVHCAQRYKTKIRVLPQSPMNNLINNNLIKEGAEILCPEDFYTKAR